MADGVKLHLGCFNKPVDGWHNTDITPHIWVNRIPASGRLLTALGKLQGERADDYAANVFRRVKYLDVRKRFPFDDGSVSAIFSAHMIEHLHPDVAVHMLEESFRVMRSGAVCRVVAPSLEHAIQLYREDAPEAFLAEVFEHDHSNPKNRHQWMYTVSSLTRHLTDAGFVDIREYPYMEGRLPDIEKLDIRPENSIYIEAIKP